MSNNEKFNALLNSCAHSRQVYNMLLAWAEARYPLKSFKHDLAGVAQQGGKE